MTQRIDVTFRPINKWPRAETVSRKPATFKTGYEATLTLLRYEISRIQGRDMVIQIDVDEREIRLDGWPRADARPRSPRVIVSFESKHGPLMYPCDRFNRWQHNVRAIALALEALRKVDRYGVTRNGEQYAGWRKLPPGSGQTEGGMTLDDAYAHIAKLSEHSEVSIRELRKTYETARRRAAFQSHPDHKGSVSAFQRFTTASEMIEKDFDEQ